MWTSDEFPLDPTPSQTPARGKIIDIDGTRALSFFIVVEPSGQYTATLEAFGNPYVEQGQLDVLGSSTFRQRPTLPAGPPVTSSYMFAAPDSLILDGETEFDINQDGTSETVDVHFELTRRPD